MHRNLGLHLLRVLAKCASSADERRIIPLGPPRTRL